MESNTSSYCMLQKLDYFSSVGLLGLVYKTVNWNCSWWGELTVLLYFNSCNNWFWLIFHLLPQSVQWRLCFSRKCENSLSRLVNCQIHQPNALHSNERVHVALHYIASCDNRQQRTAQCHTVQFNIVVIHLLMKLRLVFAITQMTLTQLPCHDNYFSPFCFLCSTTIVIINLFVSTVIQINIRRCHSDGCDTRIRGIKAVGYR